MSLDSANRDYQRIAEAIGYLRRHYRDQPSLSEVARLFGLSDAHFQRIFSRWAGISPKRFVQYLTIEYAKRQIADGPDLFDLALDAGLSGPGRLHDLFVNMEAMSPGEFKQRARGIELRWGLVPTPFGNALLAFSKRGVCHLSFCDREVRPERLLTDLWPAARLSADGPGALALAERIFARAHDDRPVSAWVVGSNLQVQVWKALLSVPSGQVRSYGQIARQVGRPGAARAVGTAIAQNPIGYLIPCHRILRQSGEIGVYHWGSDRKASMVAWEAAQRQGD